MLLSAVLVHQHSLLILSFSKHLCFGHLGHVSLLPASIDFYHNDNKI